jgi:hypothetical protein
MTTCVTRLDQMRLRSLGTMQGSRSVERRGGLSAQAGTNHCQTNYARPKQLHPITPLIALQLFVVRCPKAAHSTPNNHTTDGFSRRGNTPLPAQDRIQPQKRPASKQKPSQDLMQLSALFTITDVKLQNRYKPIRPFPFWSLLTFPCSSDFVCNPRSSQPLPLTLTVQTGLFIQRCRLKFGSAHESRFIQLTQRLFV